MELVNKKFYEIRENSYLGLLITGVRSTSHDDTFTEYSFYFGALH